jgi:hypothetical protein
VSWDTSGGTTLTRNVIPAARAISVTSVPLSLLPASVIGVSLTWPDPLPAALFPTALFPTALFPPELFPTALFALAGPLPAPVPAVLPVPVLAGVQTPVFESQLCPVAVVPVPDEAVAPGL